MKCDTCTHKGYHPAGSFYSVAEGGDDPYSYDFCGEGHWAYGYPEEENGKDEIDLWKDCQDYKEKTE